MFFPVSSVDNQTMVSHSAVSIRILDVNDNPPELATPYEASICEDAKPGQVSFSGFKMVLLFYMHGLHDRLFTMRK